MTKAPIMDKKSFKLYEGSISNKKEKPRTNYNQFYYYGNWTVPTVEPSKMISNVIFNNPLTIVIWADGTKTFVKCSEEDIYDPEKALAMAIAKKALGNKYSSTKIISDWVEKKYKSAEVE